ncbi:hypothetical protein [Streptomyces sp. I05A-00742]|uniref:hypothetical protein n=1 Tax=Streptomyces sp. I05A-00742 TaxID=2732853 RepID=UPI001489DF94|nr:hypothetical protein [Streptomyces sp. I05A-00742]
MLIDMLLQCRRLPANAVIAGMDTVLRVGAVSTDLVSIDARKAIENALEDAGSSVDDCGVVLLRSPPTLRIRSFPASGGDRVDRISLIHRPDG